MKIIAFGGSSSRHSINKKFATFAAEQLQDATIEVLDLNDYPLPLFSVDLEQEIGIPENVKLFFNKLLSADLIVLSLAEHNGSYTAAFKNLMDWLSRLNGRFFHDKKLLLLSTSPGGRGGKGVMDAALIRFPFHGANIVAHFSLPFFEQNFVSGDGIIQPELNTEFSQIINEIKSNS